MDNYAIADQFALLAKLMDIHGDNPFKSKSYASAAFNIEKLPVQLAETPADQVAALKGIGESTAKKIAELLGTGKLQALEDLVLKTPPGVLEMMQIKGLGPKKIATIWKEMGIESLGELLYACNENRLLMYKGFGEKTQESVKQAIQFFNQHKGHFLYAEIEAFAQHALEVIRKQFPQHETEFSGELLRQSVIITHIEMITTIPAGELSAFLQQQGFELESHLAAQSTIHSPSTLSATAANGSRISFTCCEPGNFLTRRFLSSCSGEFLEALTGLNETEAGAAIEAGSYSSEEDILHAFGLQPVPAWQRELASTAEAARKGPLPATIRPTDIRGIIHSHSTWSDGLHSIEAMAKACIEKGYEYLVISDHSRSAFYANGLSVERIREQHQQVEELNRQLAPFRIFKSIECDILTDGSLDYPDEVLESFDLVIASVHSNLKMTQEKAMQRLLAAIAHPATTILGHMTGRLLLSRPGYPVDHRQVIDACAEHQVAIEINAHPRRLDLDWSWIPYALEKGCLLSINPDAHQVEGFEDVKYGVLSARKGGLTADRNLSSFTLAQLEQWLMAVRQKK